MGTEGIIIPRGLAIWPHELDTARALVKSGHRIEFLAPIDGEKIKSADILMDGIIWEMKAPTTKQVHRLERILRRALEQSHNVIIDSARMSTLPDGTIERELRRCALYNKALRKLILVKKNRATVDILNR